MKPIDVRRSTVTLDPDRTHVLARPFCLMSDQRSIKISGRVMALSENEVHTRLEGVRAEFGDRQLKLDEFLLRRRFDDISPYLLNGQMLSEERKLLQGGYFYPRVFTRSRCVVQSFDGAAPGSIGGAARLWNGVPDCFTMEELRASISRATKRLPQVEQETTQSVARETMMLAQSKCEVQFAPGSGVSERVLFPIDDPAPASLDG